MGEGLSELSFLRTDPAPGAAPHPALTRILTGNPAFQALLRQLPRLAATNLPALITGEPGTGKELVAEALWALSSRRSQAFHRVNCALLGGELATSELFGHLHGSFTGAARTRLGKFQQAHRGTLFLDEVGDLDLGGAAPAVAGPGAGGGGAPGQRCHHHGGRAPPVRHQPGFEPASG